MIPPRGWSSRPPADAAPSAGAPAPTVAFLFPGQGSQRVGALGELFVAFPELRHYLEIGQQWADRLLPCTAFDPVREREQADRLRDTRVAQPALGICGLAVSHLLGRLGVHPDMSGGHSYGELVALATARRLDPMTLLDLSDARASAILSAAGTDPGTMAAVAATAGQVTAGAGGPRAQRRGDPGESERARPGGHLWAYSRRGPGGGGLAGSQPQAPPAAGRLRLPQPGRRGGQRASSPGPWPARPVAAPRLPVWSNRTAAPYPADPGLIRDELAAQIGAPVRFADQVEAMYEARRPGVRGGRSRPGADRPGPGRAR